VFRSLKGSVATGTALFGTLCTYTAFHSCHIVRCRGADMENFLTLPGRI
jgi:hypothetical protein